MGRQVELIPKKSERILFRGGLKGRRIGDEPSGPTKRFPNKLMRSLTMHQLRFHISIFSAISLGWFALSVLPAHANEGQPRRLLFFHRSAGFQHSVVQVKDGKPCYAET